MRIGCRSRYLSLRGDTFHGSYGRKWQDDRQRFNETLEETLKRDIMADAFPTSPTPNIKTNEVAYAVIDPDTLSNAYFDMTG